MLEIVAIVREFARRVVLFLFEDHLELDCVGQSTSASSKWTLNPAMKLGRSDSKRQVAINCWKVVDQSDTIVSTRSIRSHRRAVVVAWAIVSFG